ncbi:hypothetical protein BGZ76_011557, partial [Entomortierella beljakovae]
MSTPIPGSIESIHRSEYLPLNPTQHPFDQNPTPHPLSPQPYLDSDPFTDSSNNNNIPAQISFAPLPLNHPFHPSPLDTLSQPLQSTNSSSPTSNTHHSSVTFDTNSSTPSINNEYNEKSLGTPTTKSSGISGASTSGNKNNVVFSDTIGPKTKSMPASLPVKHRASFSGLNGKPGIMNPLKSVTALGALITSSNTNAHTYPTNTSKPIKGKHLKRPSLWIPDNNVRRPAQTLRSKSYGESPHRPSPFADSNGNGSYESNEEGFTPNSTSFVNDQKREYQLFNSSEPRKGHGITQSGINAIKMPFRKLRKHSGLRENGDVQDEITSDSDPENGTEGDGSRTNSQARKLKVNRPAQKPRVLKIDLSSLQPPPLPIVQTRANPNTNQGTPKANIPAYAMPYGFGALASGTTSATHSVPATPQTGEPSKESSAARFKDLIKRNVGISTSSPASSSLNSSAATTPSATGKASHQPWGATSDRLLPGSDQQSSSLVSRLKGGKKKPVKIGRIGTGLIGAGLGAGLGAGMLGAMAGTTAKQEGKSSLQDKDSHAILATMRENPHQYHFREFMEHLRQLKPDKDSESSLNFIIREELGDVGMNMARKKQTTLISRALAEARQTNKNPNVLVVELKPLPTDFSEAFTWLSTPHSPDDSPSTPYATPEVMWSTTPSQPQLSTTITTFPSSGGGGGVKHFGSFNVPGRAGVVYSATMPSNSNTLSGHQTTIQTSVTLPSSPGAVFPELKLTKKGPPDLTVLAPRLFLFKSYQNSKFQGHYVFRVKGDDLEYGKLPASKDHACSQYFREADKTYRALEHKDKQWRDERMAALLKREREFEEVRASEHLLHEGNVLAEISGSESEVDSGTSLSDQTSSRLQSDNENTLRLSNEDVGFDISHDQELSERTRTKGASSATRSSDEIFRGRNSSGFTLYNSSSPSSASSFTASATIDSYFEERDVYGEPKRTRVGSQFVELGQSKSDNKNHESCAKRSSTCMLEELWKDSHISPEHVRMETMLRAIDKAYWDKFEQKHFLETKPQIHGLSKCLLYLAEDTEFQRFEKIVNVEVLKAN